mgnify:CR=1 FL=1
MENVYSLSIGIEKMVKHGLIFTIRFNYKKRIDIVDCHNIYSYTYNNIKQSGRLKSVSILQLDEIIEFNLN